jgi:hypothetical protein
MRHVKLATAESTAEYVAGVSVEDDIGRAGEALQEPDSTFRTMNGEKGSVQDDVTDDHI